MRTVELLGAPGSGKTTIAAELVRSLDDAVSLEEAVLIGLRESADDSITRAAARLTSSPGSRLWRSAYARSADRFAGLSRFLRDHAGTLETVLAVQRQRSDRDFEQEIALGWVLNLMSRFQLASESDPAGPVVIDEGFAQRGVALIGPGFDPLLDQALLDLYLPAIPTPDLVVAVETPFEVCLERLDKRGWSARVMDLGPAERLRFLANTTEVAGLVASGLANIGVRLIWVDGTTSPQDSVARVAATLGG